MTDKITLITISLLTLLAGCAHEETTETKNKNYSASTQKEFEQIEKSEVGTRPVPPAHDLQKRPIKKVQVQQPAPKKEQVELVPDSQLSAKGQERLQEINQNLAFYCMKHRNDGSFSSEEQCTKFTQKILHECEKKHKLINTVMVNCIKDHLKKRR